MFRTHLPAMGLYTYRIINVLFANRPGTDHGKSRLHEEDERPRQDEQPVGQLGHGNVLLL